MMDPNKRPPELDHPLVPKVMKHLSQANVWLYQKTGGRLGNRWRVGAAFPWGIPIFLLTTIGRKSGEPRTTPLLFIKDGDDIVCVGSQGGMRKHPLWFLNVRANPAVKVQLGSEKYDAIARVADAEERARLWPMLVAHYADFDTYQAWTDREIPVVILSRA